MGCRRGFCDGLIMKKKQVYDLTYVTIDSVSEGVGSSQITPLISRLSKEGIKLNLISFEKVRPEDNLIDRFNAIGVDWDPKPFKRDGLAGGIERLNTLRHEIENTSLIHARSDLPAVSAIASNQAPVLWDVRSLWADQKIQIQENGLNRTLYPLYRSFESIAANRSIGMSTLTNSIVPVLEQRHRRLPQLRIVVPTAVDLELFRLKPTMPLEVLALFSGTFNDYYDLDLSALFIQELRKLTKIESHWARPAEAKKSHLGVGESKVFLSKQSSMAEVIPNYSFGVSICKLDSGPSLLAAMPTKIAEFLACGRPVVVNKGLGDMDEFLTEFNAGVILDGTNLNLKESAIKLLDLVADFNTPERCRKLAEKYFNIEVGVRSYLNMYSNILRV
jgi:glycosyltransferase involved in cell wall biosynthesis